jgi:alpha-glucosidase
VDGFRLDTVNYYFHDDRLRDNPPMPAGPLPPVNPYDMQDHVYSKTRPENLAFLKKMRALTDRYPDRMLLGEVGASLRAVEIMGEYTRGSDRLHMAYSFELLGPDFTPSHFRAVIEGFFEGAPDGWPCWSFSNHDVNRHVTRWAKHDAGGDALARQAAALLLSLQGGICLYQGEELGQTETDILWEELTDPVGLRFWPDNKGRDGCRTPMVWDGSANAGFTAGTPWLPVKTPQAERNVAAQTGVPGSVLEFYRAMLAFRRATPALRAGRSTFHDLPEPRLAFTRGAGEGALLCLYNLSPLARTVAVAGVAPPARTGCARSLAGDTLTLGPNGFAFMAVTGEVSLRARRASARQVPG